MDTVAMLMTPQPLKVTRDTSVAECARMMVRLDIRHIPVVNEDGSLAGVLTDFDIFKLGGLVDREKMWVTYRPGDADRKASALMSSCDVVVPASAPLLKTLKHLISTRQDVAIVVDTDQRPIGLFTEHDAVRLAQGWLPRDEAIALSGAKELYTVDRHAKAQRALELMMNHNIRHVVVLNEQRVCGVISYRDLVEDNVHRGQEIRADGVLRSKSAHTITPDTPIKTAAWIMVHNKVGCLPIVDPEDQLVGLVTRVDIVAAAVDTLLVEEAEEVFKGE